MVVKKIEVELTKDDIITLLADATYTYHYIDINVPSEYESLYSGNCWEDGLVNVLFNSGTLIIIDLNSDDETEYNISLKDIKKSIETEEGYSLMKELLSGDGDFWTAYNIMQLIMFGEIIYA